MLLTECIAIAMAQRIETAAMAQRIETAGEVVTPVKRLKSSDSIFHRLNTAKGITIDLCVDGGPLVVQTIDDDTQLQGLNGEMEPLYVQTIDDDTQLQGPNGEMEPLDVQTIGDDTQLQGESEMQTDMNDVYAERLSMNNVVAEENLEDTPVDGGNQNAAADPSVEATDVDEDSQIATAHRYPLPPPRLSRYGMEYFCLNSQGRAEYCARHSN